MHKAHARVIHGTRNAARPNLDYTVPSTCPCTGNLELTQALPCSTRYKTTKNPGKSSDYCPLPPKKTFERTPRATCCTDRAQTWTTACCVRRVFLCRPPQRLCERWAYRDTDRKHTTISKFTDNYATRYVRIICNIVVLVLLLSYI